MAAREGSVRKGGGGGEGRGRGVEEEQEEEEEEEGRVREGMGRMGEAGIEREGYTVKGKLNPRFYVLSHKVETPLNSI